MWLVIVGGGWIGFEIVVLVCKSGVVVIFYEQQLVLCMCLVSMEVLQVLDELYCGQGVDICCGCGVLELEDDNGLLMLYCDGQWEIFDVVVVGIGVDLNFELVCDVGFIVDCGIVVNV